MITRTSTYDECVKEIDLGVQDVMADYGDEAEISEDEVWTDLAASILVDADPAVAKEVCRCQIGHVPQSLERTWRR